MKLKNGDEIEVGGERYRVMDDELFLIDKGSPPIRMEIETPIKEPHIPPDDRLIAFYEKKGYDVCPSCGRDRKDPASTGCPMGSHYGTYCLV